MYGKRIYVAPLAGAWIEILEEIQQYRAIGVAPLAGAWIEIALNNGSLDSGCGRSPRGSVD